MENITVKDILKATGGFLLCGDENTILNNICIDSRKIQPGDLFIPLIGEKVDGHRFIEMAMETGAATLTSQHNNVVISEKAFIRVDDTQKALQAIGQYIRNRYQLPIVGVTGSVGKTTTREMIACALSTEKKCFQTPRNYNSQIGVPITLSMLKEEYETAVLEMGISEAGQMDVLTDLIRPSICVVSTIGTAHIETLKSQENIRKEKLAIIHGMSENGMLFINGDDPLLYEVKDSLPCRTMTFGCCEFCDYRAENISSEDEFMLFECVHEGHRIPVRLRALGKHNVRNCLAALAVADQMGISMEKAALAFPAFEGQRQRFLKLENRYSILDDTYNASPDSMKASIDVLCEISCTGKRFAVLGDMLELGEYSLEYHQKIGEYLCDKKIDEVIVIGEAAQEIKQVIDECETAYPKTYTFKDNEEIALYLMAVMKPEDIVLLKGSHGMDLSEVVNILTN